MYQRYFKEKGIIIILFFYLILRIEQRLVFHGNCFIKVINSLSEKCLENSQNFCLSDKYVDKKCITVNNKLFCSKRKMIENKT